jgi:putative flavoprotein involved in K+ transport
MKTRRSGRADRRTTTVVIGGGHSGLAASACLSARGIDHVVLERGQVANSWRRERWDSLRLLTPNWQSRLPGYRYAGPDPDGYMRALEVADFIDDYARACAAPVLSHTRVLSVGQTESGYRVTTDRGDWHCRTLVLASGAFNTPSLPALDTALPDQLQRLTPHQYRNPDQLAPGGVLVVGAAATGMQIADEIQRSGRQVILAAGEHVRMPRTYRGRDIQYWMDAVGLLDECHEQVDDLRRARRLPSAQLIGTPEKRTLDLNSLSAGGAQLVGRVAGLSGSKLQFSGALNNVTKLADLKLNRLLNTIDDWIAHSGLAAREPERPKATRICPQPRLNLDLSSGEIGSVIWCTGFKPDYHWLDLPVLDRKGMIRHDGGVCPLPGLYVLGLPFMRRRKSSFMFGAADDAQDICDHLAQYLDTGAGRVPPLALSG